MFIREISGDQHDTLFSAVVNGQDMWTVSSPSYNNSFWSLEFTKNTGSRSQPREHRKGNTEKGRAELGKGHPSNPEVKWARKKTCHKSSLHLHLHLYPPFECSPIPDEIKRHRSEGPLYQTSYKCCPWVTNDLRNAHTQTRTPLSSRHVMSC